MREGVDGLANSAGRSSRHILTGLALAAGAVAASAVVARLTTPKPPFHEAYSDYEDPLQPEPEPRRSMFAALWPPLFLTLTVSGIRIWNAPPSRARTEALTLWSAIQALNGAWMALGPRRLGGALTVAAAAVGASAAYIWRARRVDETAARLVAPSIGWVGFAGALGEELLRKHGTAAPR